MRIAAIASVLSLLCSGCAVLSSDSIDQLSHAREMPTGMYYALPKGVIDFSLYVSEDTAQYHLRVSNPAFVPDSEHRYVLRYRAMPNYDDTIDVELGARSFLSRISTRTEDKTDEIIVNIAKIASTFERSASIGPEPPDAIHLATVTVDPTNKAEVLDAKATLNSKIRAFARAKYKAFCSAGAGSEEADVSLCEEYSRLRRPHNQLISEITVSAPAALPGSNFVPADCRVGICYRTKEPYVVSTRIGYERKSKLIWLPNNAPAIEIDIKRAFLVQKMQTINFDSDGFLKDVAVTKGSELEAVSAIPANVLTAINETFPLRLTVLQKQTDLAKRKAALNSARAAAAAKKSGADGAASPQPTGGPNL